MAHEHERHAAHVEPTSNPAIGLPEILDMVWRRKWYLAIFMLVSIALGAAYIQQIEPSYKAGARVLVQKQGRLLDERAPPGGDEEFLATQAEIIRSPAVVEKAVETYSLTPPVKPNVGPVASIISKLSVTPVLGTDVLSVSFNSPEPEEATRTIKAVISSYRTYLQEIEHNTHLDALDLLANHERELRDDLVNLEAEYRRLHKESPLLGQGNNSVSVQKALLTNLGETLTRTRSRRIELEDQLSALGFDPNEVIASDPVAQLISTRAMHAVFRPSAEATGLNPVEVPLGASRLASGDGQNLEQSLFAAQARVRELSQTLGQKHPTMKAALGQVAYWEQLVKDSQQATPAVLQQELRAVKLHEEHLGEEYQREFDEAKEVDSYMLKEQQLVDGITRVQAVHQTVQAQLRQWQLADQSLTEGRTGVTVSVLESPDLAVRETWPPPVLLLGVCGLVGLIGGFGTISVLERTDTTVRSADDVQKRLDMPIYGRIPSISTPRRVGVKAFYRGRIACQVPDSPVAESFRALRTMLKLAPEGGPGRILQVASAREGEGKSTLTANLAFSFAQLGKRVVVVDADLRNGNLHGIFDVSSAKGLTSVLRDGVSVGEAVVRSPIDAVDVLSRGPKVNNPVELLSQAEFDQVLKTLRESYDLVLVDTPPVLTVTEASVLAPRSDGVLLSVMVGRSTITEAHDALDMLGAHGAQVMGVVVNQVPGGRSYGYYYSSSGGGGELRPDGIGSP